MGGEPRLAHSGGGAPLCRISSSICSSLNGAEHPSDGFDHWYCHARIVLRLSRLPYERISDAEALGTDLCDCKHHHASLSWGGRRSHFLGKDCRKGWRIGERLPGSV